MVTFLTNQNLEQLISQGRSALVIIFEKQATEIECRTEKLIRTSKHVTMIKKVNNLIKVIP